MRVACPSFFCLQAAGWGSERRLAECAEQEVLYRIEGRDVIDREALDAVADLLQTGHHFGFAIAVHGNAAALLGAVLAEGAQEEQAAWVLPRLLADEDEVVRQRAAEGLRAAHVLPAPVRERLRDLAEKDPSYHVRLSAEVTVVLREREERGGR